MKLLFFAIIFVAIAFGARYAFAQATTPKRAAVQVTVGKAKFSAKLADTMLLRAQGLSGHAPLGINEGMLFIFPSPSSGSFWMYNMLFPIDVVWIRNRKVIGITEDARPMSETGYRLYHPPAPYDLVLELSSHSAKKYGVRVGNAVSYR